MTDELKNFESTIQKKHSIHWNPKFQEEFTTHLNANVFVAIALKTFEALSWNIVHQDENSVEAKRMNDWDRWTEKISVTYSNGRVKVKSVSLGNELWDNGRNSKRVKLFIYAFQQFEKELDQEAIASLEKEIKREQNWEDYEIPENLPQPKKRQKPQFWIPLSGGIVTAILLGYIVSFLSINAFYIIGIIELGVAIVMGFALKHLIKASNYGNYNNLYYLLIGMILITYVSNQYFQYQYIVNENNFQSFSFWQFIQARFEVGLTIKSLNTGWIGLLISWGLQLVITYLVGVMRLYSSVVVYRMERIPFEVVDFAYYHFLQEKTEVEVRSELSKMGWDNRQDQDEVFESIHAIAGANELRRMG